MKYFDIRVPLLLQGVNGRDLPMMKFDDIVSYLQNVLRIREGTIVLRCVKVAIGHTSIADQVQSFHYGSATID